MKLVHYLDEDLIIPSLTARTKSEVLAELISPLAAKFTFIDKAHVHEVLLDREKLGTTGIGDGVAIPHGKLEDLEDVLLVAGRSLEGVDFDALDHKPVHIFFMLLAPEKSAGKHLKVLAFVSRLLQDVTFKESFLGAKDKQELWSFLSSV
ncbi:PTS sugar transporter subunit IIA [Desulfohalobiaceae bacterium Ax17]|uniref:PTS sugar transporter subunit IIA n=1 Tax=Desulfovulcanus ferrireducens TaxID=2831190 RepID=UPI00207BA59C|nr:PTS sugar transporter subunit IIA [Desulfovulcanus ferrireducens]MBT8763405.1 PTS sugar transporter subunit IIA [Desulfovulcanus ferrireducens]